MRRVPFALLLSLITLITGAGRADALELSLTGDKFWAVLASRQDADEAIAAARSHRDMGAIVVKAANGWFAAVSGPYAVPTGTGPKFLGGLAKDHDAPKDAYLTKGASFTDVVWTAPASNVAATLEYDGEHDATLRKDGLEIRLSKQPSADGDFVPVATGTYQGKPAFKMVFSDNPAEKPASKIQLVRLDPASPAPQAVFSFFTLGAHCCTTTKIASLDGQGKWQVVDGEMLDGDGGYGFEDIEGQGVSYLLATDQAFYYAFDSYAGSVAPLRVYQLVGAQLTDVTAKASLHHRLLQSLFAAEGYASEDPNFWHANGFLAGWVASSILTGRGDSAWTKMLAGYDHQSDFATEKCTSGGPLEKCPDSKKIKLAFPAALKQFLVAQKYISDGAAYRVPYEIEPASPKP
jgi:serine protease Do